MISSGFFFFLYLPVPLKLVALAFSLFFFAGVQREQVMPGEIPEAKAEVRAVEKPVRPVPVKPAVAQAAKVMVVMVNSDGSFNVGDDKLTAEQLEKKLRELVAASPGCEVSLKADALTPYQMVANGMKLCQKAGIKKVTFASKATGP